MAYLWGATLIWAFSFSLIGVYLAGQVDSYFSVLMRVALAVLVFIPWLVRYPLSWRIAAPLAAVGAVQLGCMYLFYYHSFLLLSVPEVLIFTIFTPVYIVLINDLLERCFHPGYLLVSALAVAGAAIIRFDELSSEVMLGFLVVQGANLCFAAGQVFYKRLVAQHIPNQPPHHYFGWFFVGALAIVLPAWLILGTDRYPQTSLQWGVLLWLGLVASGLGYFIWNRGATLVNAGKLAVMNDMLIPAGLLVNLLIWNRDTDLTRLIIGGGVLIAALYLAHHLNKHHSTVEA
jgi:carboxylate/amino acid/amine transporter